MLNAIKFYKLESDYSLQNHSWCKLPMPWTSRCSLSSRALTRCRSSARSRQLRGTLWRRDAGQSEWLLHSREEESQTLPQLLRISKWILDRFLCIANFLSRLCLRWWRQQYRSEGFLCRVQKSSSDSHFLHLLAQSIPSFRLGLDTGDCPVWWRGRARRLMWSPGTWFFLSLKVSVSI